MLTFLLAALLSVIPTTGAEPSIRIKGQVTDETDNTALAYADVILSDLSDKVLTYCTTDGDGKFSIEANDRQEVILTVKMLGYEAYVSERLKAEGSVDLGQISLQRMTVGLQEVTVVGEKNRIVYKLDRQSISASSSITSSGGTVVDILANTPSVLIGSEGEVTLRGSSNFLVYVDGKLSPLDGTAALQQIPAGNVEDIEILTTPSARYKTDGDAAIINIKTKKEFQTGWSGIVNASGSTLGTWSVDGIVNYRKGRNDFYFGGTLQDIKGKSDFTQEKKTSVMGVETTSLSDGERWRRYGTYTGKAGWQYDDGKHHNINIEMMAGQTSNWRGGDMKYDETRRDVIMGGEHFAQYDSHDRYNLRKNLFQASLQYIWKIDARNELALTSRFRYDWYSIEYTESNMFDASGERYEGTRGYEEEHHWDCDGSLTYTNRFGENGKLEIGYQYTTYSEHGGYRIKYWNRDIKDFEWQDDLATPFYYRRQVHSGYAMLDNTWGKFKLNAGLRADGVLDFTDIGIEGTSRDIKRFNLFPSAHMSYDAGKAGEFILGYSYRTNRPGIWNLEPYITYEDYYTKKIGNPDIRPEYINSAELGWHKALNGGHSLAVTAYYKYRKDISDWVRTAYEPGITLDMIVNAGNQREAGLEFNGSFKVLKCWTSSLNGSVFNYKFMATDKACTDARGVTFLANWINAFSVGKTTRLQFDSHYVGPRILTQGNENAYFFFEFAVRQQIFKDKLALSLVAHDIFRTAKYRNERNASGLHSVTTVLPKYPGIVLSLSYNFNASKRKSGSAEEHVLFEGKEF